MWISAIWYLAFDKSLSWTTLLYAQIFFFCVVCVFFYFIFVVVTCLVILTFSRQSTTKIVNFRCFVVCASHPFARPMSKGENMQLDFNWIRLHESGPNLVQLWKWTRGNNYMPRLQHNQTRWYNDCHDCHFFQKVFQQVASLFCKDDDNLCHVLPWSAFLVVGAATHTDWWNIVEWKIAELAAMAF